MGTVTVPAREVWDRVGVDVTRIAPTLAHSDGYRGFEHALFSRVVPTCEKLGLLDANNGWLRQRLTPLVA